MRLLGSMVLFLLQGVVAFAQTYKIENNQLVLESPILFETGSAKLKPESDEPLKLVAKYLEDKSYISTLRVEGHAMEQKLSEQRAVAVCKWLVAHGVDCKRLIAVGFGTSKPVADDSTPEGRAANTRIAFVNAALRGHLIGGMPADGGGKVAGDPCSN